MSSRPSLPVICMIGGRSVPLGERLGEGGMADVYRGELPPFAVAIKVVKPEWALDSEALLRFSREISVVEALQHPAVPTFFDHGVSSDGRPFAAFAAIDGETLRARVARKGATSVAEGLALLDEMLELLALVHEKGVLHRDIKPANIMLDERGAPYLLDFGLAQLADGPSTGPERPTLDGLPIGTPEFMAPEQALAEREAVGPWTDLFSLALTVAYALAGRSLRNGTTRLDQLFEAQSAVPPLAELGVSLPAEVTELLQKALAYAPEARFRTAAEMQLAVRFVAAALRISLKVRAPRGDTSRAPVSSQLPAAQSRGAVVPRRGLDPAILDVTPPDDRPRERRPRGASRGRSPKVVRWPPAAVVLAGVATGFVLVGVARALFG